MRNVALSLRKRRQKRHARHTSYFWVSLSLRCIFLSSSRDNFAARIFASIFATCNEWALLHWKDQTWILNRNFYFLICFFASRYFALRILQLPLSCIQHTGPGHSRGEFQLCFNVNVKLFLYFNSTLLIFFSLVFLFSPSIRPLICADEKYRVQIGIDRPSIVIWNFMLVIIIVLIPTIRFSPLIRWNFVSGFLSVLKMESFAGIVWRFFPSFVWSEGSNDNVAQ